MDKDMSRRRTKSEMRANEKKMAFNRFDAIREAKAKRQEAAANRYAELSKKLVFEHEQGDLQG